MTDECKQRQYKKLEEGNEKLKGEIERLETELHYDLEYKYNERMEEKKYKRG